MLINSFRPPVSGQNEILYQEDKIATATCYPVDSESEDKTGKAVNPAAKIDLRDSYEVSWSDSYGSSHDPFLEMD